jgi:predicted CXXCH cytochrome family protein
MIRYTCIQKRGEAEERLSREFSKFLTIGRGGNSDLVLHSNALSLEHLRFSLVGAELLVQDLQSISGLRVNGRPCQQRKIADGDVVEFAGFEFRIKRSGDIWDLVHSEEAQTRESSEEIIAKRLADLSIHNFMPSKLKAATFASALLFLGFVAYPLWGGSQMSWNSGPFSKGHELVGVSCEACHSGSFTRVSDQSCLECHAVSDHNPHADIGKGLFGQRCAECHFEHNGSAPLSLMIKDDALCVECHADFAARFPESNLRTVKSWSEHPEFGVRLPGSDLGPKAPRIPLSDKDKLIDGSGIKLNHALHLKADLRGPNGATQLLCQDCHHSSEDGRSMKPIVMERDCQSCHSLGFDSRLPDDQVPHAESDLVYKFLFAKYASFILTEDEGSLPAGFERRRPGAEQSRIDDGKVGFARAAVEEEARRAEKELFTRTACLLCHEVSERSDSAAVLSAEQKSAFETVKPKIPERWMPAARFDHGAHETVQCQECHAGVEKSEETADVLLPQLAQCQDCHLSSKHSSSVSTNCISCHSFHDSVSLEHDKKKKIVDLIQGLRS